MLRTSAASNTMHARFTSRCAVVGARQRASSTLRIFGLRRTSLALGIIPILNHDSPKKKSRYQLKIGVCRCARIAELERNDEDAHAHFGLRGLLLATFAKPSTNFTNSLPSFFAFVSGLWLKTDAGPRDGENKKW